MSKPAEEPSIESLIGALREESVKVDGATRERIRVRLADGVLAQVLGLSFLPVLFRSRLARLGAFAKTKAFAVALALPIGAALGASGHALVVNRAPAATVQVAAVAPKLTAASVVTPAANEPATSETPALAASKPEPPTKASASAHLLGAHTRSVPWSMNVYKPLNRELTLLEKARTLLSDGDAAGTLKLLKQHQWRYPKSSMEQERQSLYIKALVLAGRRVEARAKALAFVRRFPHSTLRSSVEKSIQSMQSNASIP